MESAHALARRRTARHVLRRLVANPLLVLALGIALGALVGRLAFTERATPSTAINRIWTTSQLASYLGLGDASSASAGVVCQLYFQRTDPSRWIVSLCHR